MSELPGGPVVAPLTIRWPHGTYVARAGEVVRIGRSDSATVRFGDPRISRAHLVVQVEGAAWVLEDTSSTGTYSAGQRISRVSLPAEHLLHLGGPEGVPLTFDARPGSAPPAPVVAPAPYRSEATVTLGDDRLRLAVGDRERVFLPGQMPVVGRDPACDVVVDDSLVSRRHVGFVHESGQWHVEDLGSTRGTYLDHRRLSGRRPIAGAFNLLLGDDDAGAVVRVITKGEHEVPKRRWPLLVGLAGVVVAAAIVVGAVVLLTGDDQPEDSAPVALSGLVDSIVQPVSELPDGTICASGSGTVLEGGLILTNFHVIAAIGECRFGGQVRSHTDLVSGEVDSFDTEIAAIDPELDLAVLRIVDDIELPSLERGDSDDLEIGDQLRILGFPLIGGDTLTTTQGTVSGFLDDPFVEGATWIKTEASLSGGNSGGAAVDSAGRLVGVPSIVGVGSGDLPTVDCRPLADTNGDGRLNGDDTCVPVGGFINGVRPIAFAEDVLDDAADGDVIDFDDEELDFPLG